jgi:hypothetical protein
MLAASERLAQGWGQVEAAGQTPPVFAAFFSPLLLLLLVVVVHVR